MNFNLPVSVDRLENYKRQLALVRRALLILLPIVLLLVVMDAVRWWSRANLPPAPLKPRWMELQRPAAAVPPLSLSAALFTLASSTEPAVIGGAPVELAISWKLAGVSLSGATKRALLTDPEGKLSVWVTEGETVGASRVKEIRERSVILETGGKDHEIRM